VKLELRADHKKANGNATGLLLMSSTIAIGEILLLGVGTEVLKGGARPIRGAYRGSAKADFCLNATTRSITLKDADGSLNILEVSARRIIQMQLSSLSRTCRWASSEMQKPPGSAMASRRAATLTPSPNMSPLSSITSPTLMPMRNSMRSFGGRQRCGPPYRAEYRPHSASRPQRY